MQHFEPSEDRSDDSIDTEHTADDAQKIDSDVAVLTDELRYAPPGEPFGIELGLASYTVERIDLERESGETLPDWIRHAIDDRLLREDVDVATTDDLEGRPSDYEYTLDTPSEEIARRHAAANSHEYIGVTVDLPSTVIEAILELDRDGHPVGHWIRTAIWLRFSLIDADLELQPVIEVEVPDEIAVRARLRAEHRAHRKGGDYDDALLEALNGLVQPQPEFVLKGGDVLATFAPDEDS